MDVAMGKVVNDERVRLWEDLVGESMSKLDACSSGISI